MHQIKLVIVSSTSAENSQLSYIIKLTKNFVELLVRELTFNEQFEGTVRQIKEKRFKKVIVTFLRNSKDRNYIMIVKSILSFIDEQRNSFTRT